jgi:hypothetical protein
VKLVSLFKRSFNVVLLVPLQSGKTRTDNGPGQDNSEKKVACFLEKKKDFYQKRRKLRDRLNRLN